MTFHDNSFNKHVLATLWGQVLLWVVGINQTRWQVLKALGCYNQKGSSIMESGLRVVTSWLPVLEHPSVPQLLPGSHFQSLRVSYSLALGTPSPGSFEGKGRTWFQRGQARGGPGESTDSGFSSRLAASPP